MNSYYIIDKNYLFASQWTGTYIPSSIYSFFLKFIFWLGMFFFKLISWNQHEQSVSLVALKKLMFITRYFQVAELSKIRVPFLGVINPIAYDFCFKLVKVNHIDIFIIQPINLIVKPINIILYIHGGGFVSGDFAGFRSFINLLSQRTNMPIVFPHYRLTPENTINDQVNDIISTLKFMCNHFKLSISSVIIMGDSAGGALALLTLQRLSSESSEMPKRAILISPITDLSCSGESFNSNRDTDVMLNSDVVKSCLKMSYHELDGKDPKISPLFGKFEGLPPLYFITSCSEIFTDDTIRAVNKAKDAGVITNMKLVEGVFHIFPLFYFIAPECAEGLYQIVKWTVE
jgi:acetyl esterase/lipase